MDEEEWAEAQLVADWQYEVANGDTRLGFSEWAMRKHEESL